MTVVDRSEASAYYFTYIDLVRGGDICDVLEAQLNDMMRLFERISPEQSSHRYAPGKWSVREVVGHLSDTERLFTFRALWFARGFDTALPSFDQHVAMAASGADLRAWDDLTREFKAVRLATLSFYRGLPASAWSRRGIASDNPFTVRSLAYLSAGHVEHHVAILRERYLRSAP